MIHKSSYYFNDHKMIRDLVHGYVNLSEFELKIIDTAKFQRLKDIRQLTSQDLFPSARHTRFEHSLGVLEMTKRAVKSINSNGFLNGEEIEIENQLKINLFLAALLHDVGHCPFSHLGETMFDKKDVRKKFVQSMRDFNEKDEYKKRYEGKDISISESFIEFVGDKNQKAGAVHEQISCIVMMKCFGDIIFETEAQEIENEKDTEMVCVYPDFEFIIRCILGIEYKEIEELKKDYENLKIPRPLKKNYLKERKKQKNMLIHLINGDIFDMDKLDYIMRDTVFSGINVGTIDTKRLFRNMYVNEAKNPDRPDRYEIIFKTKAVPALQNFISSRDELYMYVYNHHTPILADFLISYIFIRMTKDIERTRRYILEDMIPQSDEYTFKADIFGFKLRENMFSVDSVVQSNYSDSDLISFINSLYIKAESILRDGDNCVYNKIEEEVFELYNTKADELEIKEEKRRSKKDFIENIPHPENVVRTFRVIDNYKNRKHLKPWWKTLSEFNIFMDSHFKNCRIDRNFEDIRKKLCKKIKAGTDGENSAQFISQIAHLVIYICGECWKCHWNFGGFSKMQEPLTDGEFFIVERSNKFVGIDKINSIRIASKRTEVIRLSDSVEKGTSYSLTPLDKVLPQKDYSEIFDEDSFYIYSKPLQGYYGREAIDNHYRLIEKIAVFSIIELYKMSDDDFKGIFKEEDKAKAEKFREEKWKIFKEYRSKMFDF